MGVLQKAYTFVKKHWSTDDDVYPDDLNRYEDGIEELYNRATEQDKQINVLSSISFKFKEDLNKVDIKTITQSGIYRLISCTNAPCSYGVLEVTNLTGNLHYTVIDTINNKMYIMTRRDIGEWTEWAEVATTTKTDILCTPKAGVTIVEQKSYMVNNVVYISIMFKKTDNSAINSIFSAINVPSFARPLMEISLSVAAVDAVGNGIVNKSISCPLNTSGDIWVVSDTESVATQIRVNGVFVL